MRSRVLLLILFLVTLAFTSFAEEWQVLEGDHFFVYYIKSAGFAREVLYNAEKYYKSITTDLGYARYGDYWTWNKRAKIYIYPDHETYVKKTMKPWWSHGLADHYRKAIVSYETGRFFFMYEILPHELAHLIFRDFVPFKKNVPLWLEEGIANWEEVKKRKMRKKLMMRFYENDLLFPLKDLIKLDVRLLGRSDHVFLRNMRTKDGKSGIAIFSDDTFVNAFYIQSGSVVSFMMEKLGQENFAHFCHEMSLGRPIDDAIRAAYPHIRNLEELDSRWREYLAEQDKAEK